MQSVQELSLTLTYAEGSVDPILRTRGVSPEITSDKVYELKADILDNEFTDHLDTNLNTNQIPCACMDCRRQSNGSFVKGVKAAGGTFTAVVTDALTSGNFLRAQENVIEHTKRILGELKKEFNAVGGHTAKTVPFEDYSGCGAIDKLDHADPNPEHPSILDFLVRNSTNIFRDLRNLNDSAGLGLNISEELEVRMVEKAALLRREHYAATGKEISAAVAEVAEDNMIELDGAQKAVLAAVMMTPGEVLDHEAINKKYGDQYEVFEVSAWGIINMIKALALDDVDFNDKMVAALVYQIAAAGVIGGSSLTLVFKS